jgi:TM2 domain-containing membrane protein YozV
LEILLAFFVRKLVEGLSADKKDAVYAFLSNGYTLIGGFVASILALLILDGVVPKEYKSQAIGWIVIALGTGISGWLTYKQSQSDVQNFKELRESLSEDQLYDIKGYKDKTTAIMLSCILPGSQLMYFGQWGRGILAVGFIPAGILASIVTIPSLLAMSEYEYNSRFNPGLFQPPVDNQQDQNAA